MKSVTRTGADHGENESYVYDAAGNITSQTIGATSSAMTYDRNRLTKTVTTTGGVSTTMNHRYDVFGRASTIDVGAQVIERDSYDGYDRLIRQQKWNTTGAPKVTKTSSYDPFDRTSSQTETVGTGPPVATRYIYLGLADQVAVEEQTTTAGVYKVSKAYTHGPAGETLALVDSPVNGTTSRKLFYGANPHGDIETLTDDSTGQTTSTYRYTAYGNPDKTGTTGDDAITGNPVTDADVVSPYRFNGKRYDAATGTYDMGFREYDPGLNRYLTRDLYNGALNDLALGADPWNTNRYAFTGGNPITGIELDGHTRCDAGACPTEKQMDQVLAWEQPAEQATGEATGPIGEGGRPTRIAVNSGDAASIYDDSDSGEVQKLERVGDGPLVAYTNIYVRAAYLGDERRV